MNEGYKNLFRKVIPTILICISIITLIFVTIFQNSVILALIIGVILCGLFFIIAYFLKESSKLSEGKKEEKEGYIARGNRWSAFVTSASIICASLIVNLIPLFNKDIELPYSLEKLTILWIFIATIFIILAFILRWFAAMSEREKMLSDAYGKKNKTEPKKKK